MLMTMDAPDLFERFMALSNGCGMRLLMEGGHIVVELEKPGHDPLSVSAASVPEAAAAIINLAESRSMGQIQTRPAATPCAPPTAPPTARLSAALTRG